MHTGLQTHCTAFNGARCIATGHLAEVALKAKTAVDNGEQVLIFDDTTSQSIEVDFRGSAEEVLLRLAQTDGKETAAVSASASAEAGAARARRATAQTARALILIAIVDPSLPGNGVS